ncbi:MAG: acetylxylan esterase [Pirellulales bacterium]|jgi:cephalosporin-C deacetylase-like acetyl esterase|nr:acetylxylan esterase [Thermoguttaceae bacterium]MDD4785576.1 acetylxylan esterase [Pirellulales bacterium]MDI9443269.1 acetylxylan esterase [Planctomycetota bacterium]NLZ01539.1 acetylxylan esterase [Pirellulaceae bacterium]
MKLGTFVSLVLAVTSSPAFGRYSLDVNLDKGDGCYTVGEETACTATLLKDGKPAIGEKLRCTVKRERDVFRRDEFVCNGRPVTIKASMDRPGWLYFGFEIIGEDGNPRAGEGVFKHRAKPSIVGEIGAMYDPEEIKALDSRPADFDAYWDSCRAKLDEVPRAAKLAEVDVPKAHRGRVKCYRVEVGCLGRTPVTGYLAVPADAKPGSLPASVDYLSMVWNDASRTVAVETASQGVLALYASWHGLPTGKTAEEYRKIAETWYEEGGRAGDTDRNAWFGHEMFLRVMRALDFVKSRPEWDRKELVVRGGSLGGIQAIAAAALDEDVTVAVVSVPSACEYNGYKQGRDSAGRYRGKEQIRRIEADPRRAATLAYHDGVNFAPRIQCEIYVCTGFADELCTPSSVFAFYNALPATTRKFMSTNPSTGHYGTTRNTAGDKRVAEVFRSAAP